ncbi:MAG TPA: (Fe-S)-binding protein [Candidatus Binatia bacterium]|nr:(Fe-S)-binding protein [Candidatus Binatia bacterium]
MAFGIAGLRLWWLGRLIRAGGPAPGRTKGAWRRLGAELVEVVGQRKLLRRWQSGIPHALTFWGFAVLLFTIIETYGDVLYQQRFAIPGIGHAAALGFVEDLFSLLVLAAIGVFTVIRLVDSPSRRDRKSRFYGSHIGVAWLALLFIALVVITLLGYRAAQVNTGDFPYGAWAFASHGLAHLLQPLGHGANAALETALLLANVAIIMAFLVLLVYSKHLHILLAPVNIAFSRRPRALGPLQAPQNPTGAGRIEQLSWKQLLDLATCTECGRCQAVCPAWNSDEPLSPKLLVMSLRDHLFASAPLLIGEGRPPAGANGDRPRTAPLVPDVIEPDVVWSCTTCGACVEQCPVDIEHVDTIVDLRRQLVDEGRMQAGLQEALQKITRQGNSFGKSERARARWTRDLGFPVKDARKEPVRYLWFVGDFASFDERVQQLSRTLAQLLHDAGVDFGLLYDSERNAGNDVRRAGEEGLFEMLVEQNMTALGQASFEAIFTTDPHSFNTLRNEYPDHGLDKRVLHYSQLLDELLASSAIAVDSLGARVTYHDPCYLARYNRLTKAPRQVLAALGCDLVEMPRHGVNTFCCGAGGGRIWMEDSAAGERPSESRIREAAALGVDLFVVACPKDFVMYSDAVKTTGHDDRLRVVDLVQLVEQAARRPTPGARASTTPPVSRSSAGPAPDP